MGKFESKCPSLTEEARQQLNSRDAQRTRTISEELELAAKRVYEFPGEYGPHPRQRQAETETPWRLRSLRSNLIETVVNESCDGVREFANALLKSKDRVGNEAGLLRRYTAVLIRHLREWLNTSIPFRDEPLVHWQGDPVAEKTIQCCENIVVEGQTFGGEWPYCAQSSESNTGSWPALIMEWEASKDPDDINPDRDERLSEFALRIILSSQYRIEPGDVTSKQINDAIAEFCRHYGPIVMALNGAARPAMNLPKAIASADFWREREEQFRKHGVGENNSVEAVWSPGSWQLLDNDDDDGLATPRSARVFKSLAREAFAGFSDPQSEAPWIEWLNAMRRGKYGERSVHPPVVYTEKALRTYCLLGHPSSGASVSICSD